MRKYKLNTVVRYVPSATRNIDSWKNVLFLFWHSQLHSGLPLIRLVHVVQNHDHPRGGKGFIDYCIKQGYLI